MSHLLWKYYWENDVDQFRRLLAPTSYSSQTPSRSSGVAASPNSFATSPRATTKSRKASAFSSGFGNTKGGSGGLGKAEVNFRDHVGLTVLLRAASSTAENAIEFVRALIAHHAIDIYVQDPESGWNTLHRALYAGNISIARLLLEKERKDVAELTGVSSLNRVGRLIRTKDHEGNSPFDLYNSTIGERLLKIRDVSANHSDSGSDRDDSEPLAQDTRAYNDVTAVIDGEELFAFGSNKNLSLGVGDQDDRHFPERVTLKRPDHLYFRFFKDFVDGHGANSGVERPLRVEDLPDLIRYRPLVIRDAVLSKLHTAVLTADPVSNLYVCGVGRGGRLGLGDENTQFRFASVQGPLMDKRVVTVALGQNHTMAVTESGELWTWGSNTCSQLGYVLPPSKKDEEPISTSPRQVFGPLKKEKILGVAASSIHSVAHTGTSLFCWGKNTGQLALVDADSRSLDVQQTPRKVAASLFSSPITMVSAVDRATTCLLANHTVCVFTSYGYNFVKFPFDEIVSTSSLSNLSMSSRYDAERNRISYITSGGETIAALTGRGDLFTMTIDHNADSNPQATSTTNPTKIRNAITKPQCIWSAHKDGARSVGVGEHGSVIISTRSGAVWRRVKRQTAKVGYTQGSSAAKRSAFKFQRVPSITNIVTVRSSTFGAFAAIRKDCEVVREQAEVGEQELWDDISRLCCLREFASSTPHENTQDILKLKKAEVKAMGTLPYKILTSHDLEADLSRHLAGRPEHWVAMDVVIRTSLSPDVQLPAHGWVLTARSSVLRESLARFRSEGKVECPDFTIHRAEGSMGGKAVITFPGLDMITVLNLILYSYEDNLIPAWNFARHAPSLAYRYRQIRLELMKLAIALNMNKLEAAARVQRPAERSLNDDLAKAMSDPRFFDDCDVMLGIDGDEVPAHSSLLIQRCLWFKNLFHGRSGGMWLKGRRDDEPDGRIRIDFGHMSPKAFNLVLRYLYADFGEDLFDSLVSPSIDDFSEVVLEVLGIANELMIDRLAQICQKILGRFVTTRNIAHLLNEISVCAITEFKDAGLEYICLQMENLLENGLLDDLDEDLLAELDGVVRANQASALPMARSDVAELELHQKYPELAQDIIEERQTRVKEMAFKAVLKEDERKTSSSLKTRYGSLDDSTSVTPTADSSRQRSSRNEPFSPSLRPKESTHDLMFDMEEDSLAPEIPVSPTQRPLDIPRKAGKDEHTPFPGHQRDSKSKGANPEPLSSSPLAMRPHQPTLLASTSSAGGSGGSESKPGNPWASAMPPTARLGLKEIMSEASLGPSVLTAGLAAQKAKETSAKPVQTKLSQKERKKQQQMQALQAAQEASPKPQPAWQTVGDKSSPWKIQPAPRLDLKEVLTTPAIAAPVPTAPRPLAAAESSAAKLTPRRTASPDTRFSGQPRRVASLPAASSTQPSKSSTPLAPHSRNYLKPAAKAEPALALSMTDIIGQQQREQEIIREAAAKRSLQEIQQEQEFQEWWDQESRRTQEEEARKLARERDREEREKSGPGRRGRGGKRGGRGGRGGGAGGGDREQMETGGSSKQNSRRRGGRNRGSDSNRPGPAAST